MDESVEKRSHPQKDHMAIRDDYVNNDMFDQDEAMAAAVDKRTFLLKRLLEDQGRFPEQLMERKTLQNLYMLVIC